MATKTIVSSGLTISLLFCLNTGNPNAQPSPKEYLGYEAGEEFTPHHRILGYFESIADGSERVELHPYGESYEGRPLKTAFISSEANLDRLEEIRKDNLRLAGLKDGEADADVPAIVWLSYNIHGNESSSSEVAMQTLYSLTGGDERAEEWLENTVVIIDPGVNPDGRERYINWYRQVAGPSADPRPETREHHEPWPGGRFNHYYFDLNRDWAWQTQQETRQRAERYMQWHPHIHADFHEMGHNSPYYFAPAAEPFHEDITDWQRELQTEIGKNHTRYFDEDFRLYYTREVFDLFYPSYGDTWPTFNGAIGMTYEQAGHGRAGRAVITETGDTLTLAERIHNHHTVSLSTVEVAAREQSRITENFQNYHREAEANPPGEYDTWLLRGDNHPDNLRKLLEYLDRNRIEYGYADPPWRSRNAYHYRTGETGSIDIREDDIIIPAHQPKARTAKVLLEPQTAIIDSLTYDITAWSLPYAYGLEAYALSSEIDLREEPVSFPDRDPVDPDEPPYAYIFSWESLQDAVMLSGLLKEDLDVRISQKSFTFNDTEFEPGAVVIARRDNRDFRDFDQTVQNLARQHQRNLHPVSTGFADEGIDVGSNNMRHFTRPDIALIAGSDVSATSFGAIRHFFEQELEYPLAVIHQDQAEAEVLEDYDRVILASGTYSNNALRTYLNWAQDGGHLIAVGHAVSGLAGLETMQVLAPKAATPEGEQNLQTEPDEQLRDRHFADRQRDSASEAVRGSIYRLDLDNSHPLAFGYPDHYYTLKNNTNGFQPLQNGWNVGLLESGSHLSGFAGRRARPQYEDSMVIGTLNVNRGQLVIFADNPVFRSFWHNGKLMLANSIFMGGF